MSRVLPILFNTENVRAILEGRKTVMRRVIKFPVNKYTGQIPPADMVSLHDFRSDKANFSEEPFYGFHVNPPYKPGDILYVRETWKLEEFYDDEAIIRFRAGGEIGLDYECEGDTYSKLLKYADDVGWKPSLFMPKEVARIWLKVTDVRVERLPAEVCTGEEAVDRRNGAVIPPLRSI